MMNEDVRAEKHIEEKENETQDIIKRAFQIGQKSVIKSGKKKLWERMIEKEIQILLAFIENWW